MGHWQQGQRSEKNILSASFPKPAAGRLPRAREDDRKCGRGHDKGEEFLTQQPHALEGRAQSWTPLWVPFCCEK